LTLAALALGFETGCTREFFREWANQDVTEAIFEKSRDPRYRLDLFSIEPPALSRFADPYDQDVPPAPPDDVATEALSPVPQWPDNRLMVPVEGTGYLDMLEAWQKEQLAGLASQRTPRDYSASPPERTLDPAPYTPDEQPPGMARGGFPVTPSSDPASRPGAPFVPFVGMANPSAPGTVLGPDDIPGGGGAAVFGNAVDPQPAPTAGPGVAGPGGTRPIPPPNTLQRNPLGPGAGRSGSGMPAADPRRLSPGSPNNALPNYRPPITPGAPLNSGPSNGPPRLTPGSPNNADPSPPRSSTNPPPGDPVSRNQVKPKRETLELVRLQSGEDDKINAGSSSAGTTHANSGTKGASSTLSSTASAHSPVSRPTIPPPRSAPSLLAKQKPGEPAVIDQMVVPVSVQAGAALNPPLTPPVNPPTNRADLPSAIPEQPPGLPGSLDPVITKPPTLPDGRPIGPDLIRDVGRIPPAEARGLQDILVPVVPPMNESEAAGLPKDYRAYKIDMQQAWLLALINGRYYQYQLEQLYEAALPVTLQRFYFEPQFYAGLGSATAPQTPGTSGIGAGIPTGGVSTTNTFNYATRFSPTGQVSTLNMGTVAGFGKLFNSGGQLLMGFANQLVFNFAGKNPTQPSVLSALPISFVQPLLSGGGRAVTLEPLTQAERSLLYQVRQFAQFRQQFFVVTLTGGTVQNFGQGFSLSGFSTAGNSDPVVGFIPAAFNVVQVEIDRRNVAFYENLVRLYQELIQGEASGLSQLQVDQVTSSLISARQTLFGDKVTYRNQLDQFKMQMGLPPDLTLVLDQSFLGVPFYKVFDAVDNWQKNPERVLGELPGIIGNIPELQDIDIDGRSVLGIYRNYRAKVMNKRFVAENEDGLEDLLQAAVRVALEYRLDLQTARAALYDAWRQIRVTANALKGVLNLALTNSVYTAPGTTNPLAFLSQAKDFSLTITGELPLVRLSQRNNFRLAMINYQRERRGLMNTEDNLKVQLRTDLRAVHQQYINYEINKRNYELNVRLKDQSFEQIVAPPAGGTQSLAQSANAATQTTNLLSFQRTAYQSQLGLIQAYESYQTQRLIFYRDIGTLPYDEWEAFRELFPSEYHQPALSYAGPGSRPPASPEAPPEAAPVGR
jgi:hypothetical protein